MEWITNLLQHYPELAIFITLALGFWIGKFKIKKFTLGTVTSVLLVGVLIGQLKIDISGPLKSVFFLMFLFAVGYSVGPQFFRGLKKEGLPQMLFAAVMCIFCLIAPFLLAKLMGYNAGEAAGLLAGSQTMRSSENRSWVTQQGSSPGSKRSFWAATGSSNVAVTAPVSASVVQSGAVSVSFSEKPKPVS